MERSRSGSIYVDGSSNVLITVDQSSSHGAIVNFNGDTFVVSTAHGIINNIGGVNKIKGKINLVLQSTHTEINWHSLYVWNSYSLASDLRYDCVLFGIVKTDDMIEVSLSSESTLSECVSNIAHFSGGDYIAASRIVTEDQFHSLLSPTFSFPGLSGLGMIGSTGPDGSPQLCGIIRGNGYATPEKNIHIPEGNYSLLDLQKFALNAEHKAKFEPIFTIIIKANAIRNLYELRNTPFVVDVFANPCSPVEQTNGSDGDDDDRKTKKARVGESNHSAADVGAGKGVMMSLFGRTISLED